jgi:hypothetical protein
LLLKHPSTAKRGINKPAKTASSLPLQQAYTYSVMLYLPGLL